jgi:hypothetical protein
MPVTTKCKYYKCEKKAFNNREKRPSRSAPKQQNYDFEWCNHKDSPLREHEKGVLQCHGDVNECPIGVNRE